MAKARGRIIDETVIEVIEHILDQWTGKLTWDLLIAAIKASIATEYTSVGLRNHERILQAYTERKESLRNKEQGRKPLADARTEGLWKDIETLEAENARLKRSCQEYRAMFIRWTQNALIKGLTAEDLNKPLPPAQREASEETNVVPIKKGKRAKHGK